MERDLDRRVRVRRVVEPSVRPEERPVPAARPRDAVHDDVLDTGRQVLEREEQAVARNVVHDDRVSGGVSARHGNLRPPDGHGSGEAGDRELLEARRIEREILMSVHVTVRVIDGHCRRAARRVREDEGHVRPIALTRRGILADPEAVAYVAGGEKTVGGDNGKGHAVGPGRSRVVSFRADQERLVRGDRDGARGPRRPEKARDDVRRDDRLARGASTFELAPDGKSESVTFAAAPPGFVTVRSETKWVPFNPDAFTIPGIVQEDWAETGDASIKRAAVMNSEARRLRRIPYLLAAARAPPPVRDAQNRSFS